MDMWGLSGWLSCPSAPLYVGEAKWALWFTGLQMVRNHARDASLAPESDSVTSWTWSLADAVMGESLGCWPSLGVYYISFLNFLLK